MLENVRDEIKPDMVFWLGDSIPHADDELSVKFVDDTMTNISQLVIDELITKGDLPVFATPGNHDTYPLNSWKDFVKRDNLDLEKYGQLWSAFIPDEDQMETFLDWGYFSRPLMRPDGTKAATVISINSNVAQAMNFNALLYFQDPGNQLAWLEQQLMDIDAEGGAAIIISHVPNLNELLLQYGKRFHAILDKYQHVIRFQTTSHWHTE